MKPIAEEVLTSRDEVDSIEHKAKPYLAGGGLSRLTDLAMEVVKVWRRPAASLLRLATLRTFGRVQRDRLLCRSCL